MFIFFCRHFIVQIGGKFYLLLYDSCEDERTQRVQKTGMTGTGLSKTFVCNIIDDTGRKVDGLKWISSNTGKQWLISAIDLSQFESLGGNVGDQLNGDPVAAARAKLKPFNQYLCECSDQSLGEKEGNPCYLWAAVGGWEIFSKLYQKWLKDRTDGLGQKDKATLLCAEQTDRSNGNNNSTRIQYSAIARDALGGKLQLQRIFKLTVGQFFVLFARVARVARVIFDFLIFAFLLLLRLFLCFRREAEVANLQCTPHLHQTRW